MTQQYAVITGGTSGVGLSIARALSHIEEMHLYIIGSNNEKGIRVAEELNQTGSASTRFINLDLSCMIQVFEFTQKLTSEIPQLDYLINTAGVLLPQRSVSSEGIEKSFAIAYLSTYLLIKELTPLLCAAPHPRVLNVSGSPYQVLKPLLDFEDLNLLKNYSGIKAAIRAVHAKTAMTERWAENLKSNGISVNSFHPGIVKSELGRHLRFPLNTFFKIATLLMPNHSKNGIFVATSEQSIQMSGKLFVNKKPLNILFKKEYLDTLDEKTKSLLNSILK